MEQEDVQSYFKDLEETYGGPLRYRTFASFYREFDGGIIKSTGILCVVNRVIFFEDFEKSRNSLMQLFGGKSEPYRKFKSEQNLDNYETSMIVPAAAAAAFLEGRMHRSQLQPVSGMMKLLGKTRVIIQFASGRDWVIEPLDPKELIAALEER